MSSPSGITCPDDYLDNSVCSTFIDEHIQFVSTPVLVQFINDLVAELADRKLEYRDE